MSKSCTSIFTAEYTSKSTGNVSTKAVAKFDDSTELMFAASIEDIKASLAAGKTKADVVIVDGQYGKYAAFSNFSKVDTLA
jgi:predicted fused transcriptional regulator/phosphomethylpyrimidine kinase